MLVGLTQTHPQLISQFLALMSFNTLGFNPYTSASSSFQLPGMQFPSPLLSSTTTSSSLFPSLTSQFNQMLPTQSSISNFPSMNPSSSVPCTMSSSNASSTCIPDQDGLDKTKLGQNNGRPKPQLPSPAALSRRSKPDNEDKECISCQTHEYVLMDVSMQFR